MVPCVLTFIAIAFRYMLWRRRTAKAGEETREPVQRRAWLLQLAQGPISDHMLGG